ncbi:high-affinity nickel-transporter protein [Salinigranum sp.]|uniref:high-affinity nickel-transporter protein n=1 Tax=Salinigranum sp. TaxID=1966351 RepID=UPI00356AC46C
MSLVTALVAGGLLGVRHAVETDHVAAVAALVDSERKRPALVGASWGVGHSIPVAVVGLAFLLLGVQFPDVVFTVVEGVVGFLLVALGVRLLLGEIVALRHSHDEEADHGHLGVGSLLVGGAHTHRTTAPEEHHHGDESHEHPHVHGDGHTHGDDHGDAAVHDHTHHEAAHRSLDRGGFAVGAVHGLAGSGALVVALVATAPSLDNALAFLGGFSVLSVATMAAVSAVWGHALDTWGRRLLVTAAGVVGIVVGAVLLAEVAGVASLFGAVPA